MWVWTPVSSLTFGDIAFHFRRKRANCHCWNPNKPTTTTKTATSAAAILRNRPGAYFEVMRCHAETFGGRNSKGSLRAVNRLAARLNAPDTSVSGGTVLPNSLV